MFSIIIVVFAFFIRIFNLRLLPLTHDEVVWSLGGFCNYDRFFGIPVSCFHGYIQPFFSYLVFFANKIFSAPEYIIRVPAVVIGSATVALVYLLGKEMYGRNAGLLSSFLLCLLPWHIIQSRVGVSLILTPFFGCLIFLSLFKSVNNKSNIWFFLSWFFLGIGAFYTYQSSLLFIPIFLVNLVLLRNEFNWLKLRIFLLSVGVFFIIAYPFIYLQAAGQIPKYLDKLYYIYYGETGSKANLIKLLLKSFVNFKGNIFESLKGLFFTEYFFQYGRALHSPILINFLSFPVIVLSVIFSLYYKKVADKISLSWLVLGYCGGIFGVRFHAARYIIIVLPVILVLIGKFIAEIFNHKPDKASFKREVLLFSGVVIFLTLVFSEVSQITKYYFSSPLDLEECRFNSYGCKEAALYLSKIPGIGEQKIVSDYWMEPLFVYLNCYLSNKKIIIPRNNKLNVPGQRLKGEIYYLVWSPESHPQDYCEGMFSFMWKYVKNKYPNLSPILTVYYPNGYPAIHIFKANS